MATLSEITERKC